MQMITEVGAEQNTTTIIMMPSEFVNVAGKLAEMLDRRGGKKSDVQSGGCRHADWQRCSSNHPLAELGIPALRSTTHSGRLPCAERR
jgi:hypothetical protein